MLLYGAAGQYDLVGMVALVELDREGHSKA